MNTVLLSIADANLVGITPLFHDVVNDVTVALTLRGKVVAILTKPQPRFELRYRLVEHEMTLDDAAVHTVADLVNSCWDGHRSLVLNRNHEKVVQLSPFTDEMLIDAITDSLDGDKPRVPLGGDTQSIEEYAQTHELPLSALGSPEHDEHD